MASTPIGNTTDDEKLMTQNSTSEPGNSPQRSSSSSRPGSRETSTSDADQAGWGPMINNVPLSTHFTNNKADTENHVDDLLLTLGRHRFLTQRFDQWRAPYDDNDDDDDNDIDDNNNEEDDDFDERSLDLVKKILDQKHPSVFKFFELLAREDGHLGARIVESSLIGLQRRMDETGQWRWI